ncbi:hypothetical protein EsDP_00005598 [Epichloe bromicola]|uniref:Complex III subunit 9 n=1 Tax=Epichloe bromicola TaxID=79588 RepID=A0ABQ0CV60_9HYPO
MQRLPQSIANFPGIVSSHSSKPRDEFNRRPLHGPSPPDTVHRRAQLQDQSECALFRKNYAMLAAVFGAGFAFEVGFNNGVNKWWDNHNRGRQWKDIRNKYVEGGDEDEG